MSIRLLCSCRVSRKFSGCLLPLASLYRCVACQSSSPSAVCAFPIEKKKKFHCSRDEDFVEARHEICTATHVMVRAVHQAATRRRDVKRNVVYRDELALQGLTHS